MFKLLLLFLLFIFIYTVIRAIMFVMKVKRMLKENNNSVTFDWQFPPKKKTQRAEENKKSSAAGIIISDTRTEEMAERKIIPDDEGEYVSFKEVKE